MSSHNVVQFVNELSEKLASRSRHVCVFLGAGASRACGLSDVAGLTAHIRESLDGEQADALERLLANRDLEQVLSRVRRIAALLQSTSDKVDGLTGGAAQELDLELCRLIVSKLNADHAQLEPMLLLGSWAARADYHQPVELFTVNYDLLIESGLESMGVPYFDGFVGTLRARFRSDLVEATPGSDRASLPSFLVRLWKLHGSVNWSWSDDTNPEVIRLGDAVPNNRPAAIYPSDAKYDESRRVPFVVLQDRLRRSLDQPETLMLIAGYAFGDDHLNEIIFDAAQQRPRSEFIVFCYEEIPQALATVAERSPNVQVVTQKEAILSGLRYEWGEPAEAPHDVWSDGKFMLGDFAFLSRFLARSSPPRGELESRLSDLLSKAVTPLG